MIKRNEKVIPLALVVAIVAGCHPESPIQSQQEATVSTTQTVSQEVHVDPTLLTNDSGTVRITNQTTKVKMRKASGEVAEGEIRWKSSIRHGWETN